MVGVLSSRIDGSRSAPPFALTILHMIKNASELLAAFMAAERREVESIQMKHMPTLGAAFEAIVSGGIEKRFVLPPNLDLRVVPGFVEGLVNQIDCMLVRGEGKRYGLTDQYIYPIEQVLCVLEVKKTLRKSELVDGIGHLADVQRRFVESFERRYTAGEITDFNQARLSFSKLTGRAAPSLRALDASPVDDRMMFGTLVKQMYAPVTVLLGFDGYETEHGLREALTDLVESSVGSKSDTVPDYLPSLISVGEFSLVKCAGQPYLAWDDEEGWVTVASCRHNPALLLLEFLWTKIERFCEVKMPFGPELEVESLEKVLVSRGVQQGGQVGWQVGATSKSERRLKERQAALPWQPILLSKAAVSLTNILALRGSIELDQGLRDYIRDEHGEPLEKAITELVRTAAFGLHGNVLEALPPVAIVAYLPDGTGYASPTREPLERWCNAQGIEAGFMTILNLG